MSVLNRWWVRALAYFTFVVVSGWVAYRIGYARFAGPRPDESEREFALIDGALWAGVALVLSLVISACLEGALRLQRSRRM